MRHVDPYLLLQYYHYQLLPYLTHSTYSTTRNLTLIEIYIFSMLFPQLFLTLFSFTATLHPLYTFVVAKHALNLRSTTTPAIHTIENCICDLRNRPLKPHLNGPKQDIQLNSGRKGMAQAQVIATQNTHGPALERNAEYLDGGLERHYGTQVVCKATKGRAGVNTRVKEEVARI